MKKTPVEERFWDKVQKRNENGCRIWTAHHDRHGYGRIQSGRKSRLAHRIAWEFKNGPIPKKMLICHHCDVKDCVEITHLFLGTVKDNSQDALKKGRLNGRRAAFGEAHRSNKLTTKNVLTIRSMKGPKKEIAKQFGVSFGTVSQIQRRIIWKHLP